MRETELIDCLQRMSITQRNNICGHIGLDIPWEYLVGDGAGARMVLAARRQGILDALDEVTKPQPKGALMPYIYFVAVAYLAGAAAVAWGLWTLWMEYPFD